METNNETVAKKRQLKITFTDGSANVKLVDSDANRDYDLTQFPENVIMELAQYGWKQKVSDYRANDKLKGDDKLDAITECHDMLVAGEFRKKGKKEKISFEERLKVWRPMSAEIRDNIRPMLGSALCKKLDNVMTAEKKTAEIKETAEKALAEKESAEQK